MTNTASLSELEEFLRYGVLSFPKGPDVARAALPPMVQIYRDMLLPGGLPARQDVFATRVALDAERVDPGALPQQGVYARACVAYPSFVRQHHLALRLAETGEFESVRWIPWLDLDGIDLICLREPFAVGVALSIDTERAQSWKNIKATRHEKLRGLSMVELDANPRECRIGNFYLHPPAHAALVVERMRDLMFSCRTMAIPDVMQARAIFRKALEDGAFSGKPGWVANGIGFYWALVNDMRRRAGDEVEHRSVA